MDPRTDVVRTVGCVLTFKTGFITPSCIVTAAILTSARDQKLTVKIE